MNSPLFSIVLPTYNRPSILKFIIDVVRIQSFPHWELIIVDDSISNENEWISALADARIKYFHRGEKLGVSSARNFGAGRAVGKYLVFVDDDDRVSPDWLKEFEMLAAANDYPEVLYCGMEVIDPGKGNSKKHLPNLELWRLIIPGAWVMDKILYREVGGYDERLLYGENTELFFRIRARNPTMAMSDKVNFFYYPSLDGGSKNELNKVNSLKIILEKHKDYLQANKTIKRLYTQIIGVSLLRLRRFSEARDYLLKAYRMNPLKLKALLRLCISYFPAVSGRVYRLRF